MKTFIISGKVIHTQKHAYEFIGTSADLAEILELSVQQVEEMSLEEIQERILDNARYHDEIASQGMEDAPFRRDSTSYLHSIEEGE